MTGTFRVGVTRTELWADKRNHVVFTEALGARLETLSNCQPMSTADSFIFKETRHLKMMQCPSCL